MNIALDNEDDPRQAILDLIASEREYQEAKWGVRFDDQNTINDWVAYIANYASNAAFEPNNAQDVVGRREHQRTQLVKVAALAVAAIETIDRNGELARRHYD